MQGISNITMDAIEEWNVTNNSFEHLFLFLCVHVLFCLNNCHN